MVKKKLQKRFKMTDMGPASLVLGMEIRPDNGKSTSSYLTMLANAPLSFKSGLQGPTAMSTMEAELVASALAMKKAVFRSNMLTELGFGKELYRFTATTRRLCMH